MQKIAILMTCFKRVNTTLECLEHLYKVIIPENVSFDIYLVDDNSPDSTGRIVKEKYSEITIIQGTGSLYWTGGTRLAWETAAQTKDYDFYLWLNDDVILLPNALTTLFEDYCSLCHLNIMPLLVGAFCDPDTKNVTYTGGKNGKIIPNGLPQECDYIVGNFVLVSKNIYDTIGVLSKHYSHTIGDNDYGYRAVKNGFRCFVASRYSGFCKANEKKIWFSPDYSFLQRFRNLFSKTGGHIVKYLRFVYVYKGFFAAFLSLCSNIFKLFFPKLYLKIRKSEL